jgi:KaiC/GvpD/RAD55 family RecA-like ATPase
VVDAAQAIGARPALVVVDTLSQTYSGEENSANEMAAYLREIGLRFRALWDCAVLLIHHSGHEATERPRGSSAIRGNVDYMFGVFRDAKEMIATVSCVKQKDGELFADAEFRLSVQQLGMDDDGDPVTSLVARHLGTEQERQQARQEEANAGRAGRNWTLLSLLDTCTDESSLRRAFYELLQGLDSEAKKKAYQRAKAKAISDGHMDVVEGMVIDKRGR